ncbi:hypothetical protein RJ639_019291 [Escallonia herrerae]|uniref:Uncharacterized protein n=1 Tax=Escallonia herrerae TaxID=1293975 RepID=A0AA88V6D3_9ASTE|nr:hypothetical protein RJ639_019291 [Escallonia herrerae]
MVQTIVLPVSATFLTARMTIAAALVSRPVVGSSMKIMEGLATSSAAIFSRLRCSVDRPVSPDRTSAQQKSNSIQPKY